MNSQREVVYKQRRHALYGERISVDLTNMIYDTSLSLVNENFGGDFGEFKMTLIKTLGIECPITEQEFSKGNQQKNTDLIFNRAIENYKRKKDVIVNQAFPVIKNVFETMSGQYTNIEVPITDGLRIYRIIVNLENAYNSKGKEVAESFEKQLILAIIDDSWKEHLREMDDLKQSVQNASYEQKDPLLIYKFESYELFQKMINENNKEIVTALMKASIFVQDSSQIRQGRVQKMDLSKYDTQKDEYSSNSNSPEKPQQKLQPIRSEKKVGRNEMVKVRYQNGNTLEGKFKKFENDIANGSAVLIE
jgi:preprotein translocase subunit SecA